MRGRRASQPTGAEHANGVGKISLGHRINVATVTRSVPSRMRARRTKLPGTRVATAQTRSSALVTRLSSMLIKMSACSTPLMMPGYLRARAEHKHPLSLPVATDGEWLCCKCPHPTTARVSAYADAPKRPQRIPAARSNLCRLALPMGMSRRHGMSGGNCRSN